MEVTLLAIALEGEASRRDCSSAPNWSHHRDHPVRGRPQGPV